MPSSQQTYRVEGVSCANCAKTFENNVKRIKGVDNAEVNFATLKVDIDGKASISDIEKAGSFDNIKVVTEDDNANQAKEPFWIRYDRIIFSALLVVLGFAATFTFGSSHYLTTILFGLAALVGGLTLFKAGLINLTRLRFDMKTLMTIAVIGAILIGEWREAAIVVILFAISEALESYSMDKARASIRSLMKISPKKALIRRNGTDQTIAIEDIVIGDLMLVKPGERIAMDGRVIDGFSAINQASITGESIPVEKAKNDEVFAGTINQDGYLEIEVTKKAEDTTIAKIVHLVEEAQGERAPSQAFVDRFAAYYTPVIIAIAILVAVIPPLFGGAWSVWVYQGLAVLVVGCPCALVISTPVAIVTAIGNAARNGVLIKGGIYLEQMGRIKSIAFDKTGTLTNGTPKVTDVHYFTDDREKAINYLNALETKSNHPLAKAIVDYISDEKVNTLKVDVQHFTTIKGKGIQGEINGEMIYAGSPNLFDQLPNEEVNNFQESGKTVMLCGTNEEILLAIALRDEPRKESKQIIKQLHKLGINHTYMLTGDHAQTAVALKEDLEITDVKAGLLPKDKLDFIKKHQKNNGDIAMIGDGINDTPALAASTVGIAMGSAGTDSALETADVALMGDDLEKLPFTVKLSRRTLSIIKQNVSFAIGIKVLALLLVIPGWLTLWIAIFADMGATLLVTLNALRLLKIR
ncbi:heavy metal translocating P-type ATPase [Virgibacillus litoralis]|uniref:Cd(2+)-exporting ATPase n=1 Tax=Virgibacillus litoralis TaxID=578221 RepID=A0ABS4HIB9_9BACI|nr:heavy metal translocating P-type ATPase [Virgibacillus litoralis]MBP1950675.1 Cd2+/Zn2+-exporting ATPase [Virgibacillus litoralis]